VIDRPNPEFWSTLYDDLINRAEQHGDVIVLHWRDNDGSAYSAADKAILCMASAASAAPSTRRVALIAWEPSRLNFMANLQNLSRRPPRPAFGRGRVVVRARRALLILGRASTSQIVAWTHPRSPRHVQHSTRSARRARIAER
jgi:hypothetical protein